jgi:hypothetical protein
MKAAGAIPGAFARSVSISLNARHSEHGDGQAVAYPWHTTHDDQQLLPALGAHVGQHRTGSDTLTAARLNKQCTQPQRIARIVPGAPFGRAARPHHGGVVSTAQQIANR